MLVYYGFEGLPDSSADKESTCNEETPVGFLGQEDPLEKGQATHSSILGLLWWSVGNESAYNAGDGFDPRVGRFPGEGNSYPLQFSGLENSMDRIVHGITKSQT